MSRISVGYFIISETLPWGVPATIVTEPPAMSRKLCYRETSVLQAIAFEVELNQSRRGPQVPLT